jgi:hypothetical protein
MAFATSSDVAARLGRVLTDAESAQVDAVLDDVETIIRSRVGDFDVRISDSLFVDLVILVEAKAARRVMLNPLGIRQHSEGVDDFQQSSTFDTSISGSDTYVTEDEWALLGASSSRSGSFTMAVGFE